MVVLVVYAGIRGWLLAGLACAGLLAVNLSTLQVCSEARGYGLIFLCAMVGCTVFAEWLRSRNQAWLKILGISCVLGTYTLPFYIVFGGSLFSVSLSLIALHVRPCLLGYFRLLPLGFWTRRSLAGSILYSPDMMIDIARRHPTSTPSMESCARCSTSFHTICCSPTPFFSF